jgi:hypothetical protein
MPRIYRIMKEEDGKPKVGDRFGELGVRPEKDIQVDEGRQVRPGEGGMSVGPCLRDLPPMLVPRRLGHIVQGARGSNSCRRWSMGNGPYEPGTVAPGLQLRIEANGKHGLVEPAAAATLDAFQRALAATCPAWTVDED